jgi:DNA-binding transcriptional MerR regulator
LERLRQILSYRELGFSLEEIAEILADPDARAADHLRRQHRLLRERQDRTQALLGAVEKEMEARQMGISLTPAEQFEIFGTDSLAGAYSEEAEQRWGDTESWAQSRRRTAAYTKEDWIAVKSEADANLAGFADALASGEPATGPVAAGLAEAHRSHISRWFYDCSPEMHRGLAELYVSDPRFTATFEDVAPGLAQYVHAAICANTGNAER